MMLPSLAEFIRLIPASLVSEPPQQWLEACLLSSSDRLILLDEHHVPIRGIALHQLLCMAEVLTAFSTPAASLKADPAHYGLEADQANLPGTLTAQVSVKLGVMTATTATETAIERVAADPELWWVVVDEQQRYQGLLDSARLLAIAVNTATSPSRPSSAAPPPLPAENQMSQSDTALITYLGHELKTPLTSLLGLSSLLKMGELGHLSSRQTRYIGLIQQHCRRLAAWVNTLIDLGRIESGALRLIPQMVSLEEVWPAAYRQAALRLGREQSPMPSPPIILQSPEEPLTLVADQTRLQQMLTCLMQMALAAPSDRPESASALPLDIHLWNRWVAFIVTRTSEALSPEQFSQALSTLPFPQATATSLAAEAGHWLEWLLVRKLAQQHQGEWILTVGPDAASGEVTVRPTLLLPRTPAPAVPRSSRLLLLIAPLDLTALPRLWQQAHQLNYQLLITPYVKDAIEIANNLPIAAALVWLQAEQRRQELQELRTALAMTETLTIALVQPHLSAYLGDLPLDRELLWPTDRLGSVLLQPPPFVPPTNRLTILYLRSAEGVQSSSQKFPHIFHDFGCRVLEVDDLEQASLLRRVWKPDVAVLDPEIAAVPSFLHHLSQFPELTSLPLITLTMAAAQAAHENAAIAVYPCLVEEASWETPESRERLTTWLIQVLQVAATESPNHQPR